MHQGSAFETFGDIALSFEEAGSSIPEDLHADMEVQTSEHEGSNACTLPGDKHVKKSSIKQSTGIEKICRKNADGSTEGNKQDKRYVVLLCSRGSCKHA